jgi:prepilin-type processing-associated H-X9-DG protein
MTRTGLVCAAGWSRFFPMSATRMFIALRSNVQWQAHTQGQNILFADGHAKWYKGYNTNEMTSRYDSMHWWSE